ncbi:hypothetical protein KIL84_023029 [Mauremys mutica]|uniref:Uncharacterized protein n=1 Tax=Mauremys mutica TaxID=74926 RepID=A0A9D3WQY6_9SAUR|nr:hypothetical protein KIL84_023029 [Mauremys mutica]
MECAPHTTILWLLFSREVVVAFMYYMPTGAPDSYSGSLVSTPRCPVLPLHLPISDWLVPGEPPGTTLGAVSNVPDSCQCAQALSEVTCKTAAGWNVTGWVIKWMIGPVGFFQVVDVCEMYLILVSLAPVKTRRNAEANAFLVSGRSESGPLCLTIVQSFICEMRVNGT